MLRELSQVIHTIFVYHRNWEFHTKNHCNTLGVLLFLRSSKWRKRDFILIGVYSSNRNNDFITDLRHWSSETERQQQWNPGKSFEKLCKYDTRSVLYLNVLLKMKSIWSI